MKLNCIESSRKLNDDLDKGGDADNHIMDQPHNASTVSKLDTQEWNVETEAGKRSNYTQAARYKDI